MNSILQRFGLSRLLAFFAAGLLVSAPALVFADDEEERIPEPKDITVHVKKDNMLIRCTYYPSKLEEPKNAIPIMMLHGWRGRRVEYDYLARRLQSIGYACITVDLRGHGESKVRKAPFNDEKVARRLRLPSVDIRKMGARDIDMMYYDIDEVKLFLREENDKQKLNLEALTIIASDFSTVLATNWVVRDYALPSYIGRRQGKNCKALVLLSPTQKSEGISCIRTMNAPAVLSQQFLLISGNEGPASRQAKEYHDRIETALPKISPDAPKELREPRLYLIEKPVSIQGTRLLDPKLKLKTDIDIAKFLKVKLVDKLGEYKWTQRVPDEE